MHLNNYMELTAFNPYILKILRDYEILYKENIEYKDKIYIIEYNGRQHYEPIDYFGGEKTFKY